MEKDERLQIRCASDVSDIVKFRSNMLNINKSQYIIALILEDAVKNLKDNLHMKEIVKDLIRQEKLKQTRISNTKFVHNSCLFTNANQSLFYIVCRKARTTNEIDMGYINSFIDRVNKAYEYLPTDVKKILIKDKLSFEQWRSKDYVISTLGHSKSLTFLNYAEKKTKGMLKKNKEIEYHG